MREGYKNYDIRSIGRAHATQLNRPVVSIMHLRSPGSQVISRCKPRVIQFLTMILDANGDAKSKKKKKEKKRKGKGKEKSRDHGQMAGTKAMLIHHRKYHKLRHSCVNYPQG